MHKNDRSLLVQWYSELVRKLTLPNTRSDDPRTYRILENVKLIGDKLDATEPDGGRDTRRYDRVYRRRRKSNIRS